MLQFRKPFIFQCRLTRLIANSSIMRVPKDLRAPCVTCDRSATGCLTTRGRREFRERFGREAPKSDCSARASGLSGTQEQGSKDELAKLISLVEVYEPELASAFPRQALRQMVAAVVKEQNALAAKPDVTAFDHGQRSAVQTFAYGIQLIKDRPDLDDDTLRVQVARFIRNQRQSLAKR